MDTLQRFVFDGTDIRGEWVSLDNGFQELLDGASSYPSFAATLLGEFLAASVMLSGTLKFEGRLVLQAKSEGLIPVIMAECNSQMQYRGIIKTENRRVCSVLPSFSELLKSGTLAITIEPENGERYQGIVPLDGDKLSVCLEHYFYQSEQLNTRLFLAASGDSARGLLLQQLPAQIVSDEEERQNQWQHVTYLAETIKTDEMLELSCQDLLYRLYHHDDLRLLDEKPVCYFCSCSRQRISGMLISLGRQELEVILGEQGKIEIDCEFCHQQYQFFKQDVAELFGEHVPGILH